MAVNIAKARPSDAGELLAFLKQIGGETDNLSFGKEGVPLTEEEEAAYLAQLEYSSDGILLVARDDGRIVGNASLNRHPRRMSHRGEISVAVAQSHWNRRIGNALMMELLDFARENAFEILELQVRSDNYSAIHLYEKFGFTKLCTYPGFFKLGEQWIDFDFMCLLL